MIRQDFNYMLVSLTRQIRTLVKSKTKDSPLTFEQIRALSNIARFEGISQVELADILEAKTMATSKLIDALENFSLVKRKKAIHDRRSYNLYLTEEGKVEVKKILAISKLVFKIITKDIDDSELYAFHNTMEKIQKNIQTLNQ